MRRVPLGPPCVVGAWARERRCGGDEPMSPWQDRRQSVERAAGGFKSMSNESDITGDVEAAMRVIRDCEGRIFTLPNGIHRDVPAEDYHAIRAVSATLLKRFIRQTPAHVKAMLDGKLEGDEVSMLKGTALHAALLEPSVFDRDFVVVPDCRRGTKEWKGYETLHAGKTLLKQSDSEDVLGMRAGIWGDELCRRLIEACDERELTVIWTDDATGLQCKARVDLYSTTRSALLDVKTTSSIDRFERNAWELGYHIQLAWYSRAMSAFGEPAKSIGILAVEQGAPYLPQVFEPAEQWFIHGHAAVEHAMPRVAQCMKTGIWPGYRTSKYPAVLDVPAWASQ